MKTINSQELFYIVESVKQSKKNMYNLRLNAVNIEGPDSDMVNTATKVINELDELLNKLTNVNNKVFTVERD